MFRSIATKQRKSLWTDIVMGVAMAVGLSVSVASISAAASAPSRSIETVVQPDCDLPYADQVAKKAAGAMPDDLACG